MDPLCAFNQTSQVSHPAGTNTLAPGQFAMHPGPNGEVAAARFTAPAAGSYSVSVDVVGLSGYLGAPVTTTGITVLIDGQVLYTAGINVQGGGNQASYSGQIDMRAGSAFDVLVDWGNGTYYYDTTGVSIHVCGP